MEGFEKKEEKKEDNDFLFHIGIEIVSRLMVFSFLPKKKCILFQKMQFHVCFLKIFRPLKG